jgi:hypothetical protein
MEIVIGNYKNTKYTFKDSTRKITVYGICDRFDIDSIKLISNNTGLNNSNVGYVIAAPSLAKYTMNYALPSTTATAGTGTIGGSVDVGTHSYKITYVYDTGDESVGSSSSNVITISGSNKTVPLTAIPVGPTGVVQRKIYRTIAGDTGDYKLVTTITDNTTTTYSDTLIDSSLGATIPTTSNAYNIDFFSSLPTLVTGDKIYIITNIADPTKDTVVDAIKTIPQIITELPAADPEVASITDTNLAINTYFYEVPQSSWRNLIAQIKATCSTTSSVIKVYATLDPTIAVTATAGTPSVDWVDITTILFGSSTISVPTSGTYQDIRNWSIDANKAQVMYDRFMVSYQTLNATNFIQINIRKF